jgi:hypothetical protein
MRDNRSIKQTEIKNIAMAQRAVGQGICGGVFF